MKDEYKVRYNVRLKLSKRQLEQISAIRLIGHFMDTTGRTLKDIGNINPEWLESMKDEKFFLIPFHVKELEEKGFIDFGNYRRIKKTRKGYVLELRHRWRSKELIKEKLFCRRCKKIDMIDGFGVCEKCAKELKAKRKYTKFIWSGVE